MSPHMVLGNTCQSIQSQRQELGKEREQLAMRWPAVPLPNPGYKTFPSGTSSELKLPVGRCRG